ncbi:MAG: hypothetical protein ACPGYT_13535 [Nitrospirales bacterium]
MSLHDVSNAAIHDIVAPMFQNIIRSSNNNNYHTFSRDFSDELLSRLTQENFETQRATKPHLTGISEEIEFIDCIRRDCGITAVYRLINTILPSEFLGVITLEDKANTIHVTAVLIH